jgi:hypothetical protein
LVFLSLRALGFTTIKNLLEIQGFVKELPLIDVSECEGADFMSSRL